MAVMVHCVYEPFFHFSLDLLCEFNDEINF